MTEYHFRFSELQRFKDCRRSWMNGYYLNLMVPERPTDNGPPTGDVPIPREVGTAVDLALREFYFSDTDPTAVVSRLRAERASAGDLRPDWSKVYDLADRMVEGYVEWLAETGEDAGEVTVGTEVELSIPIYLPDDTAHLHVHIDRIVLDRTWDQWVLEDTKTVDTLQKDQQFQVDDQLLTYVYMWNALGLPPIKRARHNMLRRVLRSKQAKPPFYGRVELEFNDTQLENHERHLRGVIEDMVSVIQALDADMSEHQWRAYPHPTRDCTWKCDFLPICTAHDDGSDLDGLRQALYIRRPVPGAA